ncbi:hypothetical protein DFJ77DRAFT_440070 [Powellomyces hirtus]|nr:hypothetical protein DFJ77DRAFT_440070 [Powellomyces hirtus]
MATAPPPRNRKRCRDTCSQDETYVSNEDLLNYFVKKGLSHTNKAVLALTREPCVKTCHKRSYHGIPLCREHDSNKMAGMVKAAAIMADGEFWKPFQYSLSEKAIQVNLAAAVLVGRVLNGNCVHGGGKVFGNGGSKAHIKPRLYKVGTDLCLATDELTGRMRDHENGPCQAVIGENLVSDFIQDDLTVWDAIQTHLLVSTGARAEFVCHCNTHHHEYFKPKTEVVTVATEFWAFIKKDGKELLDSVKSLFQI